MASIPTSIEIEQGESPHFYLNETSPKIVTVGSGKGFKIKMQTNIKVVKR